MAFVLLLLRFAVTQLDAIVLIVFGWSVTALFGRLPGKKQVAVSVALILSIAWPVFVLGLVVPKTADWMLGLAHVEKWVGRRTVDAIWGTLAVLSPLLAGGLTAWAAPSRTLGILRSLIYGYPLAIGYIVAFLVTAVTVPLTKIVSMIRGWDDQHVYVQPRPGRYNAALRELAVACACAGLVPTIADVPTSMSLSTRALAIFARGMVSQIMTEQVRCVRADGLELYLYPTDLLLRGDPEKIALVRMMLTQTSIDKDAFLVSSKRGKRLQSQLGRLLGIVVAREKRGFDIGDGARRRLVALWHELYEEGDAKLPFAEWLLLLAMARRIERRIVCDDLGRDPFLSPVPA